MVRGKCVNERGLIRKKFNLVPRKQKRLLVSDTHQPKDFLMCFPSKQWIRAASQLRLEYEQVIIHRFSNCPLQLFWLSLNCTRMLLQNMKLNTRDYTPIKDQSYDHKKVSIFKTCSVLPIFPWWAAWKDIRTENKWKMLFYLNVWE